MAHTVAKTSTPDASAGSPIDVVSGDAGAGLVDRQVVVLGDPSFANPDVRPTATGALPVDGSAVTQPVSAAALEATTGTTADAAVTGDVAGTLAAKLRGLTKLFGDVWDAANHWLQVSVQNASLAVTQATTPWATRDAKDTGRTPITFYVDRIAGVTSEALVTLTINKAGATTTGTAYTVTAGKTLRLQSFQAEVLDTTTTANRVLARLRIGSPVSATSPVLAGVLAASPAALAATGGCEDVTFPDGLEVAGGMQIGVTQLASVTTAGVVSLFLVGYEY